MVDNQKRLRPIINEQLFRINTETHSMKMKNMINHETVALGML